MKAHKYLLAILVITISLSAFVACGPSEWAVKIDGNYVSMKDFNDLYYTQNKVVFAKDRAGIDKLAAELKKKMQYMSKRQQQYYSQMLDKKMFLEFVINRSLVYYKAMADKDIDQKELQTVIKIFEMKMLSSYFVKEKLSKQIKITDKEVDAFYNKNKKALRGVPMTDEVVENIKMRIQQKKVEKKSEEYLRKLIEQSKIDKSGFKEYSSSKKKKSKDWVVKIDNHTVSIKEFERYYYTEHKIYMNIEKDELDKMAKDPKGMLLKRYPTIVKENYLKGLIQGHLVYEKAMKELPKEELKTIRNLIKLQAVPAYYLSVKLKDNIKITDDQIARFYTQYKGKAKYLKGKSLNDKTKMYIKRDLMTRKFEYESAKFLQDLREESKIIRDGFKDYMKKKEKKDADKKKLQDDKSDDSKKGKDSTKK